MNISYEVQHWRNQATNRHAGANIKMMAIATICHITNQQRCHVL
jgi:hypothetical protein